jgi:hypothetical protein
MVRQADRGKEDDAANDDGQIHDKDGAHGAPFRTRELNPAVHGIS